MVGGEVFDEAEWGGGVGGVEVDMVIYEVCGVRVATRPLELEIGDGYVVCLMCWCGVFGLVGRVVLYGECVWW